MVEVIGFMGLKGAGKDATASVAKLWLEARGKTVEFLGFADPLREMMLRLDPIVLVDSLPVYSMGTECPEHIITEERYSDVVKRQGYEQAKRIPEVRRLLQVLGTEAVREVLGEDTWVEHYEKRVYKSTADFVLTTDVRFPNEYRMVCTVNGAVVRTDRPHMDYGDLHPSETEHRGLVTDFVFDNDGTLSDLRHNVEEWMESQWEFSRT
jgi:hypothetical protein